MHTMPAPTVRLLLLKSGAGSGAKIAHQGGYAKYGNPPRWHVITAAKPAPKGAPVAAHPKAAGHHEPAAHFTDDQWAALKLPDSNVNAPVFNKALEKLKAWSDAGDVTAIVGAGFGTNTYGQKLAKIANHLLGLHGSAHKVVAGQKAGTHAAAQVAEPADPHPTGLPEHIAPKVAEPTPPTEAAHTEGDKWVMPLDAAVAEHKELVAAAESPSKADDKAVLAEQKAELGKLEAAQAAGPLAMPAFEEGKTTTGVKALYEKTAQKIIDHGHAGNVAVLEDLADPAKKMWQGKTANSKKLLALHAAALAHAGGGAPAVAPEPAPSPRLVLPKKAGAVPAAAQPEPTPKEGDTKPAADGGTLVLKDGHWVKQGGDAAPVAPATQAAPAAATGPLTAEQLSNLQSIPWYKLKLPDGNSNAKSHNKQVEKIEAMAFAGDVAGLKAFKAGKNTYGKKQNLLAQTALGFLSGDAPTAEQKVRAAVIAAQPEPVAEAASLAGKPALEHIKTHFEPVDFGWSQKSPDWVLAEDAAKWVNQNPEDAEDMVSALADFGASSLAKKFKYSPPAAPAPQPVADQAAADSVPAYPKKMIDDYAASGDWSGVQMIIDNSPTPSVVAYAKQVLAGKPAPKPTRLVAKPAPDGSMGGWSFSPSNEGLDGNPSLEYSKDGVGYYMAGGPDSGFEFGVLSDGAAEPDTTLAGSVGELVSQLTDMGYPVPPAAALQKLDPDYKPSAPAPAPGPKEGDTKQGADGMLVLKNGHWVKAEGDKPNAKAIVATVPMPKLGGGTGKVKYTQKMKELKAIAEQEGAAGLSKVVSITSLGSVKIKGYKMINPNGSVFGKNAEAMAQYAKALHEAVVGAGAVGTPAAAPTPAPTTPTPPPTVNGLPSMDNWVKTGPQGGSNPGGKFKDPSGQEWYCKWPDDAEAAKSEVLAAKLYALAGLSAQDCMLVSKGGKTAIATKWVNIQKAPSPSALAAADGALAGFAVDAWLGNWDVVGLAFDNLQIGPDGKAHRVDAGGSLEYRAQGEKKPFGPKVDELETLRDAGKNAQAAAVFKGMTKADMTASAAKVLAISDVAIRAMVNQYGPGDAAAKAKLAETLIARKKDIAAKFPEAAKKKKAPTFKPEDISAPPSFLNWGGSGKSGPSSKEFLNKANEDAVQAIFAAAKTGDVEAVKKLTAPVFDKGTGAVTGQQSVLYHPSQHVSGYAQQAINELNYQLNPPKQFRFDGGHPLHSLNAAYPSHKGAPSSAAAQKLGKFIMLGEPGVIALADLALPAKITHAEGGGTLSVHTYAKQAQAAIAKMPATQKQAVKSYTGNSYHAMNGSLWDGNPTGAAKAAGEALHTLGHDIEPGTILSRHLSLHGKDLNDILGSVGKVLQEPAIMSTSIRPSSWIRNVQFKLHVGPGVKGLWVGYNSLPGGEALSKNAGEDEMVLPPGTRLLVLSVRKGGKDADGFGAHGQQHVIEAIILPTE